MRVRAKGGGGAQSPRQSRHAEPPRRGTPQAGPACARRRRRRRRRRRHRPTCVGECTRVASLPSPAPRSGARLRPGPVLWAGEGGEAGGRTRGRGPLPAGPGGARAPDGSRGGWRAAADRSGGAGRSALTRVRAGGPAGRRAGGPRGTQLRSRGGTHEWARRAPPGPLRGGIRMAAWRRRADAGGARRGAAWARQVWRATDGPGPCRRNRACPSSPTRTSARSFYSIPPSPTSPPPAPPAGQVLLFATETKQYMCSRARHVATIYEKSLIPQCFMKMVLARLLRATQRALSALRCWISLSCARARMNCSSGRGTKRLAAYSSNSGSRHL